MITVSLSYNGVACNFCEIPLNDFYENIMAFALFGPFHLENIDYGDLAKPYPALLCSYSHLEMELSLQRGVFSRDFSLSKKGCLKASGSVRRLVGS